MLVFIKTKFAEMLQDSTGKASGLKLATTLGLIPMTLVTPVVFAYLSFKAGHMVQIDPTIPLYLGALGGLHLGHKLTDKSGDSDKAE